MVAGHLALNDLIEDLVRGRDSQIEEAETVLEYINSWDSWVSVPSQDGHNLAPRRAGEEAVSRE